ncbi:MAG TPA: O-antigen ligase family protein [Nitrospinaceae bacterium]|nr:O-antigen ligase family protein [Nitrospinaceae bacterium]
MAKSSLFIFLILLGLLGSLSPIVSISPYKIVVLLAGSLVLFYALSLISSKHMDYKLIQLTPLSILFLLFLSWSALGYLYSTNPEKSLYLTIQSLGAILLYLGLILHIQKKNQIEIILKILLCFGGLFALVGILQQFLLPIFKNPMVDAANNSTSFFAHKNIFSGYLVSLIPLSCLACLLSSSKIWKYTSGIFFVLFVIALGFSTSRGGQLVAIFSLAAIVGYLIFNKDRKSIILLTQGIVISLALYFIIDHIAKIQSETPPVDDNRTSVNSYQLRTSVTQIIKFGTRLQWFNRVWFWKGGWEIFKDHWLIGSGPMSFHLLFPKYLIDSKLTIKNSIYTGSSPPHAHNIFVQTASDSGLIGVGLMLVFLILFYMRAYKLLRFSSLEIRSFVFFVATAVTSFLLHHMGEYNWPGPMFIYHFTFFIFIIDFIYRKQFNLKKNNLQNITTLMSPTLGVVAIFLTLISCNQYYKFHSNLSGRVSANTNLEKFTSLIEQAKQACPRCDRPYMKIARYLLFRYKSNSDRKLLLRAKDELLEGRKLNPYNPYYMGHLAQVFAIEGNYSKALHLLKEALKFSRTHNTLNMMKRFGFSAVDLQRMDRKKFTSESK